MSSQAFSLEPTTRRRNLSLAGLGTGLAVTAFADSAYAAVVGVAAPQTISAAGTSASGQTATIPIDIDGDANPEFNLVGHLEAGTSQVYVRVEPVEAGASIVGGGGSPVLADKLADSTSVDAGSTFTTSDANLAWSETKSNSGNWVPVVQRGHVGVAFDFDGNTHYGSLDVEVTKFTAIYNNASSEFEATLHGYVWETTPGAAILAGAAPSSSAVPIDSLPLLVTLCTALCLVGMKILHRTLPS